jgi:alpha-L-rhamnosidase
LKIKISVILGVILIIISGCTGSQNISDKDKAELLNAVWITDALEWPAEDSLMYGDFPAPLFRKEFSVQKDVKSATLFITAAGYYNAFINGKPVGKNYLDPAWTNYAKRIYYAEYDLTSDISQGINVIGTTLGNSFYNPLPLRMWGRRNLRDELPVGKPVFIARLRIEYGNGDVEEVNTGGSWKYSYGPVMKNNVYLGEVYDASKEIPGWNHVDFDDSGWEQAAENNGPGGRLEKAFFPPVQITEILKPVKVTSPQKGVYIMDMGVNITGVFSMRLRGQKGDTITFRFGERLYNDGTLNPMTAVCGQIKQKGMGGPGSPDIAWQTDSYIFGDNTDIEYRPQFTFHVYRYMEISGLKYKPEISEAEGIAFNSNVEKAGNFVSSSTLLNSIQTATERTFLDNLISVQSDCPGREKFGYGGDLNATSESFICNYDMQDFYRKTIYDYVDDMSDSVFIDTAPYVGIKYCGISWESAYIITQYQMLLYYNDINLIKELYQSNLEWMDKVERLHSSVIIDKGLSDHESLLPVPVELIGSTHYLACARIMTKFATVTGDSKNEEKFKKLAAEIENAVREMFWEKPVPDPVNRQTLFSTLLYYDIIPGEEKKAGVDSLLKALKSAPAGHFTTGIFGTKYILEALSGSGNVNTVFNVVNSTEYPGWGFMIDRGATTLWETWKESDNVYSNCHPMFGSVTEWYYRWLAGIRPDPDHPGFKKFTIAPFLPDGLDHVKCSYQSPFGEIVSNWSKEAKNITFEMKIPEGTVASVVLPVKKNQKINILDKSNNKSSDGGETGIFDLKPGEYIISMNH